MIRSIQNCSFASRKLQNKIKLPQSRDPKTVINNGNIQISALQSKFAATSALLDGTGDFLTVNHSDFDLAGGNFTLEGWFRFNIVSGDKGLFSKYSAGPYGFNFRYASSVGGIRSVLGTGTSAQAWNTSWTPVANTWYHIAITRSGNIIRIFIDGVLKNTTTVTITVTPSTSPFAIGTSQTVANSDFNGYIDEVRVSNIARYTENFTVPVSEFNNDANTLLLLHMSGTPGSTTFTDSII